ncbi:MAG: hypothetical protein ABEN55_10925 [Bradymonadaceae bacterium]
MNQLKRKEIAKKAAQLKKEKERLKEERDEALQKVAQLERRQQAEDVLIEAKDADEVPSRLKPASVDDFLAKRAQLEEKNDDELSKIASLVEFSEDGYGAEPADSFRDPSETRDPSDFEGWLRDHM